MRKELLNYTQNRELSWLRFNERVLQEAQDPTVPLLERMKFVAIFTSNLDEFFMIRVGSLYDMGMMGENHIDDKTGWSARQQLDKIYTAVAPLYKKRVKKYPETKKKLKPPGTAREEVCKKIFQRADPSAFVTSDRRSKPPISTSFEQ